MVIRHCLALALIGAFAGTIRAQETGWHSSVEANASTLFGASSQTLTTFAGALSHIGEGFTADGSFKFGYGESEGEDRNKYVSARNWLGTVSVDATPKGRFSPFVFGSAEASLEKRIANRRSGGAGAKWVFAKSGTGSASISLALLGERTAALSDTAVAATSVARWSWRVKMAQQVDERLTFTHVTFYAPVINAPGLFTITSTSVGSIALNKALAFALTFTDNYDSQARGRGAPTNNDGSLLFGIRANF
jgi:Protein of unknown function, DUF481